MRFRPGGLGRCDGCCAVPDGGVGVDSRRDDEHPVRVLKGVGHAGGVGEVAVAHADFCPGEVSDLGGVTNADPDAGGPDTFDQALDDLLAELSAVPGDDAHDCFQWRLVGG